MSLLGLSLKNATIKWWRSLTFGFFIFAVCFVMVLSGAFITAARDKVGKVILNGFTGNLQIRSEGTMEGDMVTQYNPGWDALKPIDSKTITTVNNILSKDYPDIRAFLLARRSAFLENADKREQTMLVGIGEGFDSYKDSFLLTKGRYLDPDRKDEILLTEEQAAAFKVDAGDTIAVTSKDIYGRNSTLQLKVAGIGNYIMLSMFSYKADYTSADAVRQLSGMGGGEATDMILYTPASADPSKVLKGLAEDLRGSGVEYSITRDEKLKSDDLKVTELDLSQLGDKDSGVMISSFDEMGNSFKGVSDTMFAMLNILVVFVIVIASILIINLVYMAGLERYREIGTLRAIGFSRLQTVRIFMGEVMLVSVTSGILGVLISSALVYAIGALGVNSPIPAMDFIMGKTLSLEIDFRNVVSILAIITGFSFAASFYPAWKACSIDPAESIRTV